VKVTVAKEPTRALVCCRLFLGQNGRQADGGQAIGGQAIGGRAIPVHADGRCAECQVGSQADLKPPPFRTSRTK
jgi:hypothetical protein